MWSTILAITRTTFEWIFEELLLCIRPNESEGMTFGNCAPNLISTRAISEISQSVGISSIISRLMTICHRRISDTFAHLKLKNSIFHINLLILNGSFSFCQTQSQLSSMKSFRFLGYNGSEAMWHSIHCQFPSEQLSQSEVKAPITDEICTCTESQGPSIQLEDTWSSFAFRRLPAVMPKLSAFSFPTLSISLLMSQTTAVDSRGPSVSIVE